MLWYAIHAGKLVHPESSLPRNEALDSTKTFHKLPLRNTTFIGNSVLIVSMLTYYIMKYPPECAPAVSVHLLGQQMHTPVDISESNDDRITL